MENSNLPGLPEPCTCSLRAAEISGRWGFVSRSRGDDLLRSADRYQLCYSAIHTHSVSQLTDCFVMGITHSDNKQMNVANVGKA